MLQNSSDCVYSTDVNWYSRQVNNPFMSVAPKPADYFVDIFYNKSNFKKTI